jgi:DNA (cytosine-5)-methyltransferase 1
MLMDKKYSIFSFFAGLGFLDLGFEKSDNHEVVFVNEYDQNFVDSHKYSRDKMKLKHPRYGYDVVSAVDYLNEDKSNKLAEMVAEEKRNGKLVGFMAGPPCPDFSVGGKNRGQHGENGKLSKIYIDMVIDQQPDFFLFENVKGLWRTKKHREFFDELKRQLHAQGYVTTEKLMNARWFGVPQDRDRIILLGFKKELLKKDILVRAQDGEMDPLDFDWEREMKYTKEQIKSFNWPTQDDFKSGGSRTKPDNVPAELTVEHWFKKNMVESHPNGKDYFQPRAALPKFEVIPEGDTNKKSYKRLHRWRYSPTCAYGNNEVHLHPYLARRISVAEAMSLQSLPKEFQLPPDVSLSAKFKMIGNGVPFVLSKGIADTLSYFLEGQESTNANNSVRPSFINKPTTEESAV